jgi:hypothetical protein
VARERLGVLAFDHAAIFSKSSVAVNRPWRAMYGSYVNDVRPSLSYVARPFAMKRSVVTGHVPSHEVWRRVMAVIDVRRTSA